MNIEKLKSPPIIALIVILVIGAISAAWYLGSPLFLNDEVDEAFPVDIPTAAEIEAMSDEEKAEAEAEIMEAAADMPDTEMDEEMPASSDEPVKLLSGTFVGADAFHEGEGVAAIFQLADGSHVLRFEDFEVTNGPDLHVLLASGNERETLGDYVDLGSLKGNIGNQNYTIPADVDISQFDTIVIYCMPFHVVFSSASLGG